MNLKTNASAGPASLSARMPAEERRRGFAFFALTLPNIAAINCFPFLFGALIDHAGMQPSEAGSLIGLELLAGAAVAILLARVLLLAPVRTVAWTGASAITIANLLSAVEVASWLPVLRAVAGVGLGLCLHGAGRVLAGADKPARLASRVAIASAVASGTLALSAGALSQWRGVAALFTLLAAVGLLAGLGAFFASEPGKRGASAETAKVKPTLAGLAVIAAAFLAFTGSGAVWNGSERIGVLLGLTSGGVGTVMAVTGLAGIAGGVIASFASRAGRPFLFAAIGAGSLGGSAALLAIAPGIGTYVLAMSLLTIAFVFVTPFLLAITIVIDPKGSLASATQGGQLLAGAAAPAAGGLLMTFGFSMLSSFAAAAGLLSALAIFIASLRAGEARLPGSGSVEAQEARS